DVPVPVLRLSSDVARFHLPEQTEFGGHEIYFLALNPDGPAGVLPPGGHARADVIFGTPDQAQFVGTINLTLDQLPETTTKTVKEETLFGTIEVPVRGPATIDWASLTDQLRPAFIPADAWVPIFANFIARVGDTVVSYEAALADAATYLSQLGQPTGDINQLLGFLFQQASNAYPGTPLAAATDAAAPAPGVPPALTRVYNQSIAARFRLGPFGRGWSLPFDLTLQTDGAGHF